MLGTLRFAPPWTVEETEAGLVVKDHAGQAQCASRLTMRRQIHL